MDIKQFDQTHKDTLAELSTLSQSVIVHSRYKHYKGGEYVVLAVGRMEADHAEEVVVYQSTDKQYTWVRPVASFVETVTTPEYTGPRFILLP